MRCSGLQGLGIFGSFQYGPKVYQFDYSNPCTMLIRTLLEGLPMEGSIGEPFWRAILGWISFTVFLRGFDPGADISDLVWICRGPNDM